MMSLFFILCPCNSFSMIPSSFSLNFSNVSIQFSCCLLLSCNSEIYWKYEFAISFSCPFSCKSSSIINYNLWIPILYQLMHPQKRQHLQGFFAVEFHLLTQIMSSFPIDLCERTDRIVDRKSGQSNHFKKIQMQKGSKLLVSEFSQQPEVRQNKRLVQQFGNLQFKQDDDNAHKNVNGRNYFQTPMIANCLDPNSPSKKGISSPKIVKVNLQECRSHRLSGQSSPVNMGLKRDSEEKRPLVIDISIPSLDSEQLRLISEQKQLINEIQNDIESLIQKINSEYCNGEEGKNGRKKGEVKK